MATRTFTSTVYERQGLSGQRYRLGMNFIGGTLPETQLINLSVSDIVFLCRIPNRATIVDWYLKGNSTTTITAAIMKMGIVSAGSAVAGTESTFGSALTFSSTAWMHRPGGGSATALVTSVPFKVSISDTDAQAGALVYATASSGTFTTSLSLDFGFWYVHDGHGV